MCSDVKKAIQNAKERIIHDAVSSIPKLFNEEQGDLCYRLRSLYRQRNQAQGVQKEPKSSEEEVLDEDTLKMTNGRNLCWPTM